MQHEIVLELAQRFEHSTRVEDELKIFLKDKEKYYFASLVYGYPAVALFYTQLDLISPEQKFKKIAYDYLEKTIDCIRTNNLVTNSSFFTGITGLAFVVWVSSENGKKYQKLIARLDTILFHILDLKIAGIKNRKFLGPSDFDVIQGLSGVLRYLLLRKDEYKFIAYIKLILDIFIQLSSYIDYKNNSIPGWIFIREINDTDNSRFEDSNESFNLGLSHGISGVLAVLSLAKSNGIHSQGVEESILNIKNWLLKAQQQDKYGIYWPNRLSLEEELTGIRNDQTEQSQRQAWCYGTPGVSRALYLAGQALDESELQKYALASFLAIEERPEASWRCNSPTFCHGYSGLLQIAKRFYFNSKEPKLLPLIARLEQRVISFYAQEAPYLFKDKNEFLKEIGLLEGVVGTALSLIHTDHFADCVWDIPFLIS